MRQPFHSLRAAAVACALCSASLAAFGQTGDHAVSPAVAHKQKSEIAKGDPARWYKPDNTDAARMRTLKKEIAAAYTEARNACQRGPAAARASCLKQARSTWQHDLANAPAELAAAPQAESFTEHITTMGASQAGQTASGGDMAQPQMVTERPAQGSQMQSGQPRPGAVVDDTTPPPQQQQQR